MSHLHRRADHFTAIIQTHQSYERTVQVLSEEANAINLHQPQAQMPPPAKLPTTTLDQSVQLLPTGVTSLISPESQNADTVSKPTLSNSPGQLLGLLGISSRVGSGGEQIRNVLGVAVLEWEQAIREHSSNQDLADTLLLAHLHNAAETNQVLADVLYADSPDGRFSFVGRSIEERTVRLESAIDDIGSCMAGVDLDVLQQTNKTEDELVNRWAA